MSHFAVIVVIPPEEETIVPDKILERIDKEMAPFMENCCGEPDKIYMKFYDTEDEMLKEYEEGEQERIVMPDGRLLLPWDETFRATLIKDGNPIDLLTNPKAPPDLPRRMVPFRETFSTFEEFVAGWHGKKSRDETYNRYGYFQNPQAKWDWYEVGGRWAGYFQLKKGRSGGLGSQYNWSGELESSTTLADVCFKNAVDLEGMRQKSEDAAAVLYDKVHEAIKDTPVAESWDMIKADFDLIKPDELEKARDKYHDQPRVKAFTKLGIDTTGWMAGVEEYQIAREQYLRNARNDTAVPHAVLKDGKWCENGEMGWFGVASNEKDPETWSAMVNKLMDDLPGEAILAAIDCHI